MAREVNLVCNFFFGFMHTNLTMDTVDVELPSGQWREFTYIERTILQKQPFLLCGVKV